MGTLHYTGLTAYLPNTKANFKKLSMLTKAIKPLHVALKNQDAYTSPRKTNRTFAAITASEHFQNVSQNAASFVLNPNDLPGNISEAYRNAQVCPVVIRGAQLLRLYIPAASKNPRELDALMHTDLKQTLIELFGDELISLKSKTSSENLDFDAAPVHVLISVGA